MRQSMRASRLKVTPQAQTEVTTFKNGSNNRKVGPVYDRKCRDLFWLLLFIAFWVGMITVASKGWQLGNPDRLLYGTDYLGNLCGTDNTGKLPDSKGKNMLDKPFLYYPALITLDTDIAVCVDKCPEKTTDDLDKAICLYDVSDDERAESLLESCWFAYASTEVLNRCVPTLVQNATQKAIDELNARETAVTVAADVVKTWWVILASAGLACLLGWVWIFLMKRFAGVIVWLTVLLMFALLLGVTAWAWLKAKEMQEDLDKVPEDEQIDSDKRNTMVIKIFSYIMIGVCVIFVLLFIFMCKRIRLAVVIIEEASQAMLALPLLPFFPLVIFVLLVGFMAYWIAVFAFLNTAGKPVYDMNDRFAGYQADTVIQWMSLYHVFGLFWNTQLLLAINQCTIAGAVASWYWVRDKKKDMPRFPVARAFKNCFRYHLGSLAFGSLIIAIVKFIRFLIKRVHNRVKGKESRLAKFILKCMSCCFACLERFLKFLNKNAYIMIAIYGYSFCNAAKEAFKLILNNILRVGTVSVIGDFLLFLGKVMITIAVILFGVGVITNLDGVSFWIIPVILIGIVGFGVASAFMNIYEMAIDTILLSFCEDSEVNNGTDRPYFMSENLRKFVSNPRTSNNRCGLCCC